MPLVICSGIQSAMPQTKSFLPRGGDSMLTLSPLTYPTADSPSYKAALENDRSLAVSPRLTSNTMADQLWSSFQFWTSETTFFSPSLLIRFCEERELDFLLTAEHRQQVYSQLWQKSMCEEYFHIDNKEQLLLDKNDQDTSHRTGPAFWQHPTPEQNYASLNPSQN